MLAAIQARAGKSNRGAPGYSRWINRPLGRRVAAFAAVRGISPNQLTATNAILVFPALLLLGFFPPSAALSGIAALILMTGYVLDSADGQLARLTNGGTKAGEWLDHVSDALKTATCHAVIAVVWFRYYTFETPAWLLIPIVSGVVYSTFFFSIMLADDLRRLASVEGGLPPAAQNAVGGGVIQSFIKLPNDWGIMCIALMLLPVQWAFVSVYTLLLVANTVFLLVGGIRWYRRLSDL